MTPGHRLEETITRLDTIIDDAADADDRMAIFPAMYRSVTAAIHEAVKGGGFFDDDERLEEMTVGFAGLYLDAHDSHRSGRGAVPACWDVAFAATSSPRYMILQHLLLGMNAHINHDLGIATVRVAGPDDLPGIYADFVRVNEVLFRMVDDLQGALSEVSPRMGWLDRVGLCLDEAFMRMSIRTARDLAWRFAERLAQADDPTVEIAERDADSCRVARLITRTWSPLSVAARFIAGGERSTIREVVDALRAVDIDLDAVQARVAEEAGRDPLADRPLRRVVARPRVAASFGRPTPPAP